MIDVSKTIYSTILDKLGKLRYQAIDDLKSFRSILELIIISDIYEWTQNLDMFKPKHDLLLNLQREKIMKDCAFIIENTFEDDYYTNVNTPQTRDTWKRVWDSENVIEFDPNKVQKELKLGIVVNETKHLQDHD